MVMAMLVAVVCAGCTQQGAQNAATTIFDVADTMCIIEHAFVDVPAAEAACGIIDNPANQAAVKAIISDFKKTAAAHPTELGCAPLPQSLTPQK